MEIKIINGALHQWDTTRAVQVTPDDGYTLQQVLFSCPRMASPIIVTPDADGRAVIPDGLLRHAGVLTVNAMLTTPDRKRLARSKDFPVEAAVMPEGYTGGVPSGSGGGSGGGSTSKYAQPDWGVDANGEILPELRLDVNPDEGTAMITAPFAAPIVDGEVYTVGYNGTEYQCTAVFFPDINGYLLGNGAPMGYDTHNADAPFLLMVLSPEIAAQTGMYAGVIPLDGSASCTLYVKGEVTHKIPEEYIEGGGVYYFGVDDDGATTKTFDEILAALRNGKQVCANYGANIIPVSLWGDTYIHLFGVYGHSSSHLQAYSLNLAANGENSFKHISIATT